MRTPKCALGWWTADAITMGIGRLDSNRCAHFFTRYTRWRGDGDRVPARTLQKTGDLQRITGRNDVGRSHMLGVGGPS
jgi:hypothetical protein